MRRTLALLALGLATLASAQYPGAQPPPEDLKKGFDSIEIKDAQKILGYLAGPECQGRGTGQPGFQKAAEFVAKQFKAAHLKPLGDDGTFFQNAIFYRPSIWEAKLTVGGKGVDRKHFSLTASGADVDLTGDVVLVRLGSGGNLTDEQLASLKGRVAVTLYPKGAGMGRATMRLASQIGRAGAVAVLNLNDRIGPSMPRASMRKPLPGSGTRVSGQVDRAALALDAAAQAFLDAPETGVSILDLGREAHLTGKGAISEVKVPNVVGEVEGSDPTLKAEVVGVGGHLDHLGINADGVVYPGADDDGSGSTAVMLIAKAVAANPVKPMRSVIFMTFFGEEMGLLGSKFLTEHPPVPLSTMVAELQMDMVGRDSDGAQNGDTSRMDVKAENVDTIRLVGSKRISTDLDKDIQEENRYVGFRFKYDAEDVYTRSDHYNFAAKGVPIAFLFDGFHPDYHQPTDTVDKIDWTKLTNAAKLYYLTLMKVANDPAAPVKDVKGS